jgi:hypothetical protein
VTYQELEAFDPISGKKITWNGIQTKVKNRFNRTKKIVKIDNALQKWKRIEKIINQDASVFFNRAEKIDCPINKHLDFIDRTVYYKGTNIFQNDMFWLKKGIE